MSMRNLAWPIAVGFFFLNPSFACGTDEAQFQYGAPEMRGAVEGNWALTITPAGGTATQVVVHVAQASSASTSLGAPPPSHGGIVRTAFACGSRTLVRSAAACVDLSEMPLAVSYVSGDASFAGVSMSGTFTVPGLVFGEGNLESKIGPYQVLSQVAADGLLGDPHLGALGTTGTLGVARE